VIRTEHLQNTNLDESIPSEILHDPRDVNWLEQVTKLFMKLRVMRSVFS
jgi:hypothetical protein